MSEVEEIPVEIFLLEFQNKNVIRDGAEKKGNFVGTARYFAKISILSKIYGGNNHGLCLSELM